MSIPKATIGTIIGNFIYEHKEEIIRLIVPFTYFVVSIIFIVGLYWAASDFPAFWAFLSLVFTSVVTFMWWAISNTSLWFWEKYRAMYLVVQVVLFPVIAFFTYEILFSIYKIFCDVFLSEHRTHAWIRYEDSRRSKGLASLNKKERQRKKRGLYPPRLKGTVKKSNKTISKNNNTSTQKHKANHFIKKKDLTKEVSTFTGVLMIFGAFGVCCLLFILTT